tara:strand:- start:3858 stop:4313 length:456 start_codon:yes stop_codon:yes gene_type:complete
MADRTSRDSQTREKKARVETWRPPSTLEAPEPPVGFKHRWIRESVMEFDDRNNVHKRRREGWELVRSEDYPDFDAPVIDEGKNAGVIGVGGLVLARIPEEIVEQRDAHYRNVTENQMDAVDRDWMRESNAAMPKLAPQRSSKVTFGSKGQN